MSADSAIHVLGAGIVILPILLVLAVGIPPLLGRPLGERTVIALVQSSTGFGLIASVIVLLFLRGSGTSALHIGFGSWISIPDYHFSFKFVFDWLSAPFAILTFALCGIVSVFASRYLHREPGFTRFFVLYSLFLLGMILATLADTIETLFSGWELVGLSSALLVAFYQSRPAPAANGLHIWTIYRISDAAFLVAMVLMHHLTGEGDFEKLLGGPSGPDGSPLLSENQAFSLGLLFLLTAAGKSALVPFSGWLPRAMEGPTPSSAIFYGSLSVHLGAFLLLRISPILHLSETLAASVVSIGLLTAVYGAFVGRVQTDIKSALSFASLTQVGLIVMEIGLGLQTLALVHIIGHACLRTLQFLRAPSALHDHQMLENAISERVTNRAEFWQRLLPPGVTVWMYRLAMERGYLDAALKFYFVHPLTALFREIDRLDRGWSQWLGGGAASGPFGPKPVGDILEDRS